MMRRWVLLPRSLDCKRDYTTEHHRKWSFEQEFMTLLKKSGAEYDARFVFG
jgi:hypothetical protein